MGDHWRHRAGFPATTIVLQGSVQMVLELFQIDRSTICRKTQKK
jgi:hypothetical protein